MVVYENYRKSEEQRFSLADYDIEYMPREAEVPEAEFTKFKLETPKSNNVSAFGGIAERDSEKYLEF